MCIRDSLSVYILVLQEYNLNWEYIPGKKNVVADTLSRVNIKDQTYEGEKETVIKIYHIIKSRTDLANIMKELEQQQEQDPKLNKIRQRLTDKDDHVSQFYCKHQGILFIKTRYKFNTWKIAIPRATEKDLILDYHERYGHMGALKVVKALQEHKRHQQKGTEMHKTMSHLPTSEGQQRQKGGHYDTYHHLL